MPRSCRCSPAETGIALHAHSSCSDWDRIKSPTEDKIVPYGKLSSGEIRNLNKLAVLKVNGGLGTSMGESPL